MQNTFCIAYLIFDVDVSKVFYKDVNESSFAVQLAILFTVLTLHFSCIQCVRNGLGMCKFVVFHSHEFDDPGWAFLLGVLVMWTTINCEFVNILNALH